MQSRRSFLTAGATAVAAVAVSPSVLAGTATIPRMGLDLQPFQRRFLSAALKPGIRTSALSLPRGNGKSTLVAWLGSRALTPGDALFVPGAESHIVAASIGQARRTTFKLLREFIEGGPAR